MSTVSGIDVCPHTGPRSGADRLPRTRSIDYAELRHAGVPEAAQRVGSLIYVIRGGFFVAAAGGVVVWATWLSQIADDPLIRAFEMGLPIWIASCILMGWAVGLPRFARVREGTTIYYFAAAWIGAAATVTCLVGPGLRSPLVAVFPLVIAYDAFVLRPRESLRCTALLSGYWLIVALLSPPGDINMAIFQVPLLVLGWAVGWVAHRAYADAARTALELSTTDPVTGSRNRAGVHAALGRSLTHAEETGGEMSVLMLDLDAFKTINDTEGHAAGDDLLRWVATRLGESVRDTGSIGRIGGDEFVAVLRRTGAGEAERIAGRVAAALDARVGASVGWATYPADGHDASALLRAADRRLYEIKRARRGAQAPGPGGAPVRAVPGATALPAEATPRRAFGA